MPMGTQGEEEEQTVTLTAREIEVLRLVVQGKPSKEVAELLFVSKRTVDFHLANIYTKLDASNRMEAMQTAMRCGLLPMTLLADDN